MKTLVSKRNPQVRITAPEIKKWSNKYYFIKDIKWVIMQEGWTLVEEESKHTEVWVEGRTIFEQEGEPTEGIKGNLEEIPSNVDLEKDVESWFFNEISPKINIENTMYHYFQECAHRYYNLGLNARKGEREQQEVNLEEFTEKMDAWKARFNHPDDIPIKATMAFTARMFYQYPDVARQWYEQLPKAEQI